MTSVIVDTDVVSYVFKNHPFGSRYDAELTGRIPLILWCHRVRTSAASGPR